MEYYGKDGSGLHLPFNFQLIQLPWEATTLTRAIEDYERQLPAYGWPNWVLGNHDKPRVASRVGSAQARVAAMLLLTLRGTPTIYYGEEVGMSDSVIAPEQVRDTREIRQPGHGRDPVRTPMQWSGGRNAGFTAGSPWLPVNPKYADVNVERQRSEPTSILALYRRLIKLRRSQPALTRGSYRSFGAGEGVIAYLREAEGRTLLVALNLTSRPKTVDLPGVQARVLLSTHLNVDTQSFKGSLWLRADEGTILDVF
jgi:alpha-glucosidase